MNFSSTASSVVVIVKNQNLNQFYPAVAVLILFFWGWVCFHLISLVEKFQCRISNKPDSIIQSNS